MLFSQYYFFYFIVQLVFSVKCAHYFWVFWNEKKKKQFQEAIFQIDLSVCCNGGGLIWGLDVTRVGLPNQITAGLIDWWMLPFDWMTDLVGAFGFSDLIHSVGVELKHQKQMSQMSSKSFFSILNHGSFFLNSAFMHFIIKFNNNMVNDLNHHMRLFLM